MIINNETGEIIEESEEKGENYQLAKRELNELAIFDEWLEVKENLETAKERFDMVDKPFRKAMADLFEKFSIKRLENDYIDIIQKNGYMKSSWDEEKLKAFIYRNGADPKDFKTEKWQNGTLQIKYKE
ncbi:MAG: hypothetical protein IJJ01_07455 [Firmicutes bacterium]|nr:hypothetical protein [Bacillota bacterium]